MIRRDRIFVGGKWEPSSGTATIGVINPATEQTFAEVPRGTSEDVDRAVRAASAAFSQWSLSAIEHRAKIFGERGLRGGGFHAWRRILGETGASR